MNGTAKMKHLYELIREVCFTTGAYDVPLCDKLFSKYFCFDDEVDFRKMNWLKLAVYNIDAGNELEEGLEYYADLTSEETEAMASAKFNNVIYPQLMNLINRHKFDHVIDKLEKAIGECDRHLRTYKCVTNTLRHEITNNKQQYVIECCKIIDTLSSISDEKETSIPLFDRYVRNIRCGNYQLVLDIIDTDLDEIKKRIEDLNTFYHGFIKIMRDISTDAIFELIAEYYHLDCITEARMKIVRNTNAVRKICKMMDRSEQFYLVADGINVGEHSLLDLYQIRSELNNVCCRRFVSEHLQEIISHVIKLVDSKPLEIDRFVILKKQLLEKIAMEYRLFRDIFDRLYYLNEETGEYNLTSECKGMFVEPETKKTMVDLYEMKPFVTALNSDQIFVEFTDNVLGKLCELNTEMKYLVK